MGSNSNPTVSVITTCFNRERFVGDAIESVLNSSFTDFELLVVDDGSTDDTVPIVERYARQDRRVRIHLNDTNLGDYPNRNHAASLSTGKYLKYIDADDYLYPHGLRTLVEMMSEFPCAGYGLCSLDQDRDQPYPFSLTPRQAYVRNYFETSIFHKAPLSSIILRSAWQQVGGFPETRMVGDFAMWHRLSMKYDVVLMPHGPVWYREHDHQEVNDIARNPVHYKIAYDRVVQEALASEECPLNDDEKRKVLTRYQNSSNRLCLRSLVRLRLGQAFQYRRHAKGLTFA